MASRLRDDVRLRERERGTHKFRGIARNITVTGSQQRGGGPDERHWSNPNARLIYAAVPFRTATLKTLTAFNFRWPSILFSLVWTTLPRTEVPFALRHAPHAFAKEITCPLPPSYRFRPLLSRPSAPLRMIAARSSENVRLRNIRAIHSSSRVAPNNLRARKNQPRHDEADSSVGSTGTGQFLRLFLNNFSMIDQLAASHWYESSDS